MWCNESYFEKYLDYCEAALFEGNINYWGNDRQFVEVQGTKLTSISGVEGFTTEEDQEMLGRIEKQLKRRFVIGSQVSEHAVLQDFLKQVRSRWASYSREPQSLLLPFIADRSPTRHI